MSVTTYERYKIETTGIKVSLMIWRRFKKPMIGMAERIFALNPGLADLGPFLPLGTVVVIPIDPPAERVTSRPVVQLWDDA